MGSAFRASVVAAAALALAVAGCGSADAPGQAPATGYQSAASGSSSGSCSTPPTAAAPTTYQQDAAPTQPSAPQLTATLRTSCGDVEIELFGDKAPVTVASFEFLAEQDYWADSACHRLTTQGIYVLQCGDPTGTGRGGPGYTFGIENAPADGSYPRGTVAMARSQDPNSNGGQFFIVQQDSQLPVAGGGYTIFGKVTGGMDIIDRVAEQGVLGGGADGAPAQPISILSVVVNEGEATSS